jgi:hypothetical protein
MTHSYISKATINFIDYNFYVRPGDLLVHNPDNHNRLTVYRNGQIVKVAKQDPIGITAFLKNRFIEEVVPPTASLATMPEAAQYSLDSLVTVSEASVDSVFPTPVNEDAVLRDEIPDTEIEAGETQPKKTRKK